MSLFFSKKNSATYTSLDFEKNGDVSNVSNLQGEI